MSRSAIQPRKRAIRRAGIARRQRVRMIIAVPIAAFIGGFIWYGSALPDGTPLVNRPVDALIVLTGSTGRLAAGLDLLENSAGKKLLVTGVDRRVSVDTLLRLGGDRQGELASRIIIDHQARDTPGNAREAARWMRREGYQSLRLVTASYHMPRSLLLFHRAMPDIQIVAHPVAPHGFRTRDWWRSPAAIQLLAREYVKYLISFARLT